MARLLAIAVVLAGCGEPALVLESACTLSDERLLAVPDAPVPDAVALVALSESSALAFWSERAGLFARALSLPDGAPSAEAERLGPGCDAGLAAAAAEGTAYVACARRGDDAKDEEGAVQILRVDPSGRASTLTTFGPTGPSSSGVSILADARGRLRVGWQQARGAHAAAWLGRWPEGTTEQVSPARFRASAPSLAGSVAEPIAAWSETWVDREGETAARIQVREGSRAPHIAQEMSYDASLPRVSGEGASALLAFRDRRPAGERPRVFVARALGTTVHTEAARGMPANTTGAAFALGCGPSVFVIAPRTHSRHERLIAVRRYSPALEGLGPEHQIYAHGAAFEQGDAICAGHGVLVLYAGRASREDQQATIRTIRLGCAEAAAPTP